ncbi:formate dehydrogenase subunit delta [Azohydromonas australica]|uniref:formate dehydrogenase subunit delta n=1 Tax=Azohydromonas australica TaxID=364039 RepID=UPI0004182862|nr:formate dehydrogenase subunit delta [Azohydromonas australica]
MDVHNLVHMANRIGDFFQAMPDREEAIDGIAQHLHKFWEPRMRRLMLEHVDQTGTAALHPLVAQALERRREALR